MTGKSVDSTEKKFDAFWHLQAIGLLEREDAMPAAAERKSAGIWESLNDAKTPALVAIIDTGVSGDHPYLPKAPAHPAGNAKGAAAGLIDVTGGPIRQFATPSLASKQGIASLLDSLGLSGAAKDKPYLKIVQNIAATLEAETFDYQAPPTSNLKFSSHGTSCAGLIAASDENNKRMGVSGTYYRGVDPCSRVLSITTSFAPRPDLLTLAILKAAYHEADVILFPRSLPNEILYVAKQFAKEPRPNEAYHGWQALKETILAVAAKIPVVCAAGNESISPIAPASFATKSNGIICVAAMNCHGMRSSYSNFGPEVTLAGPSDDAEIFNEDQARFDRSDRFFRNYPYDHFAARLKATMETVPFGKAAIRAIDVPGAFGYSDTGTDDIDAFASDPESYFTDFGGTSAASSIVAGVAALVQRAAKLKRGKSLTGPELKKLLVDTARKVKFPHLSQLAPACKDKVDGWPLEFGESFGAGLVAADRAVNLIMTGNPDTPVS